MNVICDCTTSCWLIWQRPRRWLAGVSTSSCFSHFSGKLQYYAPHLYNPVNGIQSPFLWTLHYWRWSSRRARLIIASEADAQQLRRLMLRSICCDQFYKWSLCLDLWPLLGGRWRYSVVGCFIFYFSTLPGKRLDTPSHAISFCL